MTFPRRSQVGRTLARAFVTTAALLASATLARAQGQNEAQPQDSDVAMALPQISLAGPGFPRPLAPSQAAVIRRIFALQAEGDIEAAEAEHERLGPTRLDGAILADRFQRRWERPSVLNMTAWMDRYADLSDAPVIHALLAAVIPRGMTLPALPAPVRLDPSSATVENGDAPSAAAGILRKAFLDRTVRDQARAGRADLALRTISQTRGLGSLYAAQLRAEVARIQFTQGLDSETIQTAELAQRMGGGGRIALSPFMAGLAWWRMDRPDLALPQFESAARATFAAPGLRAASAYWAARARLRTRDPAGFNWWMRQAAQESRTFYGMLASRALGASVERPHTGGNAILSEADLDVVSGAPAGARAFALLQVNQRDRAEAELRQLWLTTLDRPATAHSIQLVAGAAGFTGLASDIEDAAVDTTPDRLTLPPLRPTGGFRTDPALVYALTRLESNFDADARSPAGARGLMQIMPLTADFITIDGAGRGNPQRLHNPGTNLSIGQRYLAHLSTLDIVGGDLIRLLAAYNAGPGNVAKWLSSMVHKGDPLLFMEAIPVDETRAYVPRALAYTWLYAARLRLPTPSLDELAAGAWPRFAAVTARELPARLR